jgi:hypothetical protein
VFLREKMRDLSGGFPGSKKKQHFFLARIQEFLENSRPYKSLASHLYKSPICSNGAVARLSKPPLQIFFSCP